MKISLKNSVLFSLLAAAVLSRFIPHPPNMTAITALALFAGQKLESKWVALTLPLAALFISDLVIGFHPTMFFVYGAFLLITFLSLYFLEMKSAFSFLGSTVAASTIFFLISNFGVWIMGSLYPKTSEGLANCFLAALPFFQNQLVGDLLFTGALFGSFAVLFLVIPRDNKI